MIDHLSLRELDDVERAAAANEPWARVLRSVFVRGTRLVLGIDSARREEEIGLAAGLDRGAVGGAIADAARWCAEHGLHLLGYPGEAPGEGWRHFMAVG